MTRHTNYTLDVQKTIPFSLNSSEFLKDPYPFYDKLRSPNPVSKVTLLKYSGWYITGYDEAIAILKDTRFKNRIPLPQASKKYNDLKKIQNDMMVFKNPPDHMRLRKLVGNVFSTQVVEQYRPYIEETVIELIDRVQNKKSIDIVSDLAFPLTSLVIAKIVGVPEEDRNQFREWTVSLIQTIDIKRDRNILVNGNDTALKVLDYFKELIKKRKQNPKDDLISMLIKEAEQGEKLTDEELLATCILLIIAGHETTVNLISNSMLSLLNHPDQLKKLKETPPLIKTAVEEFLRYESPTQMTARVASEDIEINNKTIREGEQVYIFIGAVNHDPKKFTNPNQLDISRNPNPHLAFGYGSHFCLGSTLARVEAQIAINVFLQRMSNIQLTASIPKWRELTGFRSLQELPITATMMNEMDEN
ncbi:cytochrome P450 [Salipaludibacillus sp. CF4.18]|uniref:cytochrome P450 n=1 Tax=Salipaludibacillus sp. CF4.18 TaxID=3373081 RepID=UPI003EE43CF8